MAAAVSRLSDFKNGKDIRLSPYQKRLFVKMTLPSPRSTFITHKARSEFQFSVFPSKLRAAIKPLRNAIV